VIIFIFICKLLVKTGCGEFFIDLAMALMGKRRGGAAKISIVSSALFGSISGSAISNVVTTGVMTIPLMKRSGYTPAQSAEIRYSEVVIAAIIPALLYFISVLFRWILLPHAIKSPQQKRRSVRLRSS
jgi:TRAP-type uncharacterized transport system fused permease subunit